MTKNSSNIANGTSSNAILPLPWFGEYFVKTSYPTGCVSASPLLTIKEKKYCDPDSMSFKPGMLKCYVKDCELIYEYSFNIYNASTSAMEILTVNYPNAIILGDNLPLIIPTGESASGFVEFIPPNVNAQNIPLQLVVLHNGITYYATTNVLIDMLDNPENCFGDYCDAQIEKLYLLQSGSSNIYIFSIQYDSYMQNVSIVADAGSIIDYHYDEGSGMIDGVLNLSDTWVANFCADPTNPEFCFKITGCSHDVYCTAIACIDQSHFCGAKSSKVLMNYNKVTAENELCIVPNPAKDIIQLKGKDAEKITYIKVLDLNGKVVHSGNKIEIEISTLVPTTYILHIDMQDGSVKYLKLIKQ